MAIEALEGISDQDLFNEANADEASADEAVVEAPEAVVEHDEQHRDEQGRYAAQAAEEAAPVAAEAAQAESADDKGALIPSFRLKQEADARRQLETDLANERADKAALRQRLEALERPAPKVEAKTEDEPDPLLDPKGYKEFVLNQTREIILNDRRESSLQQAHRTYKGEFEEAYAAAQKQVDPVLKMKMQQSRDPGETLIQWHREQKTRAEVGTDPNAYFDKRLEAFLADPANQGKVLERIRGGVQPAANGKAPPVNLPPSLTRATSASSETPADDDDLSNDGLWRHANA